MTNPTSHGQVPAIQRYKIGYHSDEWGMRSSTPGGVSDPSGQWVLYKDHIAALHCLHAENKALRAQQDDAYNYSPQAETVEEAARDVGKWLNERPNRPLDLRHVAMLTHHAKRTAHVQNPAEIEHVAGDVSKNGAELNTSTQQPAPAAGVTVEQVEDAIGLQSTAWDTIGAEKIVEAVLRLTNGHAPATQKLTEQICISDTNQSAACAVGNVGTTSDAQTTRSTHDAPATQQAGEVVAYLDIGAGGYLDLGSELSDEDLQQLPKGRHALVIAGTYGIDGYVAAHQPSPTAQAADSVREDAARLDWLALAGPTSICLVIDRPHDGEVEVSTDDVTGYGKTLREALDAARKQGDKP